MIQYGVVNFVPNNLLISLNTVGTMNAIADDDNYIYFLTPLNSNVPNRNQLLQYSKTSYSLVASYPDFRHEITLPYYSSAATMSSDGVDLVYSMTYSPPAGHPDPPPLSLVFIRKVYDLSDLSIIDINDYGYAEAYSSCIYNRYIYITTRMNSDIIVVNADDYNDYNIISKSQWTGSRKIKIFNNKIYLTATTGANMATLFVCDLDFNIIKTYGNLGNNILEPRSEWNGYVSLPIPGGSGIGGVLYINEKTFISSRTSTFIDNASVPGLILYPGGGGMVRGLYNLIFRADPGAILYYNNNILQ